ncbi:MULTISPECIES: DUF6491 family protein [unclassified Sphingobium]|uniref:DUF6491 family protein n=1 Tax=unclassified Sphingobium TaxID=2611147 RepID=UPI00222518C3|nr:MULTISPECIES: DUF6491 family protein [unclassified Sphingobium]MCW2382591.1 hypothetical protein [Sphingobium sp. B2D3B]MCW2397236.1 hypothetical protein [Sphingobium sp. B2D3C]
MMNRLCLSLAVLPLAACATAGPAPEPRLSERETQELERLLERKTAGEPVSCVTSFDSSRLRSIGDNTLVYVVSKDQVYLNRLQGSCTGISRGDTLVMNRMSSSQYCRGDIARVVNLPSGAMTGSCALGDFIPYRTPGK